MIEAQVGIMLPQAKEHLGPPEAGRGKEGSLLSSSLQRERGTADSLLSEWDRIYFYCFKP